MRGSQEASLIVRLSELDSRKSSKKYIRNWANNLDYVTLQLLPIDSRESTLKLVVTDQTRQANDLTILQTHALQNCRNSSHLFDYHKLSLRCPALDPKIACSPVQHSDQLSVKPPDDLTLPDLTTLPSLLLNLICLGS